MKSLNYLVLFSLFLLLGMQNAFSQKEELKNNEPTTEVIKKEKEKDSVKQGKLKDKPSKEAKRARKKNSSQSMTSKMDENGNEIFTIEEKDPVTGEITITELIVERKSKGTKSKKKTKLKTAVEKQ